MVVAFAMGWLLVALVGFFYGPVVVAAVAWVGHLWLTRRDK